MKIALVQQHCTSNVEDNIARGLESVTKAVENGAELIAFAELSFLPFLPQNPADSNAERWAEPIPGKLTSQFLRLSKEHGVVIILNLFEEANGKTYDSSPVIDTDGSILGVTRMVHVMDGLGFHEKGYYTPGDRNDFVYDTGKGRIGVAICYDRHFPEYMRNLGLKGAQLVVIPQAGVVGEWPEGLFEAEMQVAGFQNGYYTALVNRVGKEEKLHFSGESFVTDPSGQIVAKAPREEDFILYSDCDFEKNKQSAARKYFIPDRRPDFYRDQFQLEED